MTLLQTYYEAPVFFPASLSFLLLLLPLFLFIYYVAPLKLRPGVLLAESVLFYLLAAPDWFPLMAASVLADWALLRIMARYRKQPLPRKLCVWIAFAKAAGVTGYALFTVQRGGLPQVLGAAIYPLLGLRCVLDAWDEQRPVRASIVTFPLYCIFFPRLYAGPLSSYREFKWALRSLRMDPAGMLAGFGSCARGALKAGVIGIYLYQEVFQRAVSLETPTALSAWLTVISLAFSLFYLLSGLSDMAVGIGLMYGFKLPQNFYYPYQSRNIEDFLDRFLVTVNRFFRDACARLPLNGPLLALCSTLSACVLTGLWFGLRPNYALWGLYLGILLLLERYAYPRLLELVPTLFCRMVTLCATLAGFAIFACDTPGQSLSLLGTMFGFSLLYENQVLYLLASNWLLLLVSCFFATNIANLGILQLRKVSRTLCAALLFCVDLGAVFLFLILSV